MVKNNNSDYYINMKKRLLMIERPDLASQWDYEKNKDIISFEKASLCSNKKVWWICQNGHSFLQSIVKRTSRNQGCPYCAGRKTNQYSKNSLINNKSLMDEWSFEKNKKDPSEIPTGSEYYAWWKCSKGHLYQSRVNNRYHGKGCPYCAGKKVITGFNDLKTTNPIMCEEWDAEKNIIKPTEISAGSQKKVWWKCKCGNSYLKSPNEKNTSGCPICGKRPGSSFPEQCIYYYIKQIYPNASNRNNIILENKMELDIYIPEISTAIEYDGSAWHSASTYIHEKRKYSACVNKNIKLIRIRESAINKDIEGICDLYVLCKNAKNLSVLEETIHQLFGHLNISADINLQRDKDIIRKQYLTILNTNSLESVFPDLASEWNYSKNNGLLPSMFDSKSGETVWWMCKNGHEWEAKILNRANGNNCPFCNNSKILKGFNDLETLRPQLAKEWDKTKNINISPDSVTLGSSLNVWWLCKNGHSWKTRISTRVNGHGCPKCARERLSLAQGKKIKCIETNAEYASIADAQRTTGIKNISRCIHGKTDKAGGYHWILLKEKT